MTLNNVTKKNQQSFHHVTLSYLSFHIKLSQKTQLGLLISTYRQTNSQ